MSFLEDRKTLLLPIVKPGDDPRTGCYHCPLAALAADFPRLQSKYQRDAEKIQAAQKVHHVVLNRCVSEPWTEVDILCIGEAPGHFESKEKRPFVGKSGRLLRDTMAEVCKGEGKLKVGFCNCLRCQPPMNRDPGAQELRCCTPELIREIKARKPKVIVALGAVPFKFLTGLTGIVQSSGKPVLKTLPAANGVPVVPCIHPAYVLRRDFEFDRFADSLAVAVDIAKDRFEHKQGDGNYKTLTDVDEIVKMLAQVRKAKRKTAIDTETGTLTPFQKKFPGILCLSFSNEEGTGYVIPWDHKESPWTRYRPDFRRMIKDLPDEPKHPKKPKETCAPPSVKKWEIWEEWNTRNYLHKRPLIRKMKKKWRKAKPQRMEARRRIKGAIKGMLADPHLPKTLQNGKFDQQHMRHEWGAELRGPVFDTIGRHVTIDDTVGSHGLDRLALTYTGMGGYDKVLSRYVDEHPECDPNAGGSYANIPGKILFLYAAQDSDITLRVDNAIECEKDYAENPKFAHSPRCSILNSPPLWPTWSTTVRTSI